VSAHDELRALLQRYARAADRRDAAALAALFTPGAEITGARGHQSLEEWLEVMRGPATFPTSMHVLGDPLIEHRDGSDLASLDTYAVVYQLGDTAAGQGDLTLGIHYLDEVVLADGAWRIDRRTATTLWMR
jgi:hypothetical protein